MSISKKSSTFASENKESCLSGRKSRTRNAVYTLRCTGGSNPSLSAKKRIGSNRIGTPNSFCEKPGLSHSHFPLIVSKPCPKTPFTLAWLTKALGSMDLMIWKMSWLSCLRAKTVTIWIGCWLYHPVPSKTVTPR